jgi:hypothetical protein
MQKSTTFTTILRVKKCHFHYDMQKIVICTTSYESHTFFHEFAENIVEEKTSGQVFLQVVNGKLELGISNPPGVARLPCNTVKYYQSNLDGGFYRSNK